MLGHGHYDKSSSENAVFLLLFFSTLGHGSDKLCKVMMRVETIYNFDDEYKYTSS